MLVTPLLVAVILGLVEGITEFLPVSSTGHLIVAGSMLGFAGPRAATFEIVIQVGAILAVVWHYRELLAGVAVRSATDRVERRFVVNVAIAFIPAAAVGLVLRHFIKAHLFTPLTVAIAFIAGGLAIFVIEWSKPEPRTGDVRQVSIAQAFGIGCVQVLALVPGTSRSAATILGGYLLGLTRPAATEFSFLLAIPTLGAAAAFDIFKSRNLFTSADIPMFVVGIAVSFVSALVVIRTFLRYVRSHSFTAFAWYRLAFGALILALAALHMLRMDAS